ncbi:MAG: MFS transporter [Nevskia sp.]|nr:MFS transporter [Nevskia sp.]
MSHPQASCTPGTVTAPAGASAAPPSPAYAWYTVGVLVLAYTFSFLDRQILSLLVEPIKRDLGINDTAVSLLQGFAFALFLALGGIPIGRRVDTGRRVTLIACGIALWSLMTAACGLARGYGTLLLCRMGVGAGESTLTPSAYSVISDCFPPRRLGLALGVYSVGVYIGGGLALLLGAALIARLGEVRIALPLLGPLHAWQLVFLAVGLPGLLVAAWAATLREPARRGGIAQPTLAEVRRHFREHAASLVSLNLCMAFAAMMNYAVNAWVPSLLIRSHGWSAAQAGRGFGLLVVVCGGAGVVCGGWLGDRLVARGLRHGRLLVMSGACLAAAPFIALAPLAGSPAGVLALLAPAMLGVTMTIGCGPGALQEIMPNRMRGVASAAAVLVVNLIGLGLGPTCIAAITDYVIGDERRIGLALAAAAPVMLLVSAAFGLGGLTPYQRSHERMVGAAPPA